MNTESTYQVGLGIMSGTSCDGLDLALCSFAPEGGFEILAFESTEYAPALRQKLLNAMHCSALELLRLERDFSEQVAAAVLHLLQKHPMPVDYIAAHGHTVIHRPAEGLSFQMLNGALLAQRSGLTVVCDFRRQDVAEGGQGAPLVPIGDCLLFPHEQACLNVGGFANVSFPGREQSPAYDITVANLLLDALAAREGMAYDAGGALARQGEVQAAMLSTLNGLDYFAQVPPKSLGREWYEAVVWPIFAESTLPTQHLLATAVEHIAQQVAVALRPLAGHERAMVTGGGAFNDFLVERIKVLSKCQVHIPPPEIVAGKEALIFALLGKLRLEGAVNVLAPLTGARRGVSAGAVYRVC